MIIKSSSYSSREFGSHTHVKWLITFFFKIDLFYVYRALPACQKRAFDAIIDGCEPTTCNSNFRGSEASGF